MTEFKVGDKVIINSNAVVFNVPVGAIATVVELDTVDEYDPYVYKVRYGTKTDWVRESDIEAYTPPDQVEIDHWSADGAKASTPIDLPTVKFIYWQWETILDMEGLTDEVAANVFSGYISGLMQGLKGDFDD